jgi:acyl transferase domain-containing protein/NAD(P)-dependent dehydrogenase (short-subunit alcohol dehydrogenase family)
MAFFVMPYRMLFHDTMAYGSHHFLTNFKLQCEAREQMFFDAVDASQEARAALENTILLTQQAYSRNLGPVSVGEKVAILLSAEEPTVSSVRFCFRVIRHDGVPVSCGFQTLVCVAKNTKNIIPAPPVVSRCYPRVEERLRSPSFAERILAGKVQQVFDKETIAIGVAVANASPAESFPRFLDDKPQGHGKLGTSVDSRELPRGVVFGVPGQGSCAAWLLRELHASEPSARLIFQRTDEITRALLGAPFLPLIEATTDAEHEQILRRTPDLLQIGIFLGGVLPARFLMDYGLEPDVVVGHSAGELAALAIAGVYDVENGIELVCHRLRALRAIEGGGMVALSTGESRVRTLIEALRPSSLEVAIVNHDDQTVVSGTDRDVDRLQALAAHLGTGSARLQSPYPFHSRLLEPAVAPFAGVLRQYAFRAPQVPVYSPIACDFYSEHADLPDLLSSQLVRPFHFPDAVRRLHQMGARLFVECGAGRVLSQFVRNTLRAERNVRVLSPLASGRNARDELRQAVARCAVPGVSPPTDRGIRVADRELPAPCQVDGNPDVPIAVVSMGCILPGASDPDAFWENILARRSGLFDVGEVVPELAAAFKSTGEIVPDKTYTLLGGFARGVAPNLDQLPYEPEEFARLTASQRFLAIATSQCLLGLTRTAAQPKETHVFMGATADGSVEYDEALLVVGLQHIAERLDAEPQQRVRLCQLIERALGHSAAELPLLNPYSSHVAVLKRLIGEAVKVVAVDAACASSLYAIDLGIKALRDGECGLALCGGVFAPGPANSCLFSQFRGLSGTGSRPFDAAADGVVFGEGAAFVTLKRLPDALAAGDCVHAVIRGTGLSNDGKSPSVAVPQKGGQVLALRRAYQRAGIDPATVQYIEAHATATPVGDDVEFAGLTEVFNGRGPQAPRIELGSIKALIGHTGWVAGAASVIKMAKALEAKVVPPQANFTEPSRGIDLERSPFVISTAARPWPQNAGGEPRRAGINGFGFGGSNAHVMLEAFEPDYHYPRWAQPTRVRKPSPPVAVVGVGALFPFRGSGAAGALRFDRTTLRLPTDIRILPDAADHIDAGQVLAIMAATLASEPLRPGMTTKSEPFGFPRADTAVVLGVEGKTGRGISANQRIYLDFVAGRIERLMGRGPHELEGLCDQLFAAVRRIMPSNPYTLPGLMPNVTAGRVSNVFNLGGPCMTLDVDGASLRESLSVAAKLLERGECDLVLAGGINGYAGVEAQLGRNGGHRPIAEGALVLLLARHDAARERGFRILAELSRVSESDGESQPLSVGADASTPDLKGVEGAVELVRAIQTVAQGGGPFVVQWQGGGSSIRISPSAAGAQATAAASPARRRSKSLDTPRPPSEASDGNAPTVYFCSPRLAPSPPGDPARAFSLGSARLLLLVDDPACVAGAAGVLARRDWTLMCPASASVPGAIAVDLSSESAIAESLRHVDVDAYDAVVAVKDLSNARGIEAALTAADSGALLDLVFAVARRLYDRLKAGATILGTLCLGVAGGDPLPPCTGLLAGFMKSLARELARGVCKALTTDERDLDRALGQLEMECRQGGLPSPPEVVYREGVRHAFHLEGLGSPVRSGQPWLDAESVVLATGGARGVTAVLVEEILRRFGCTVVLVGRSDPNQMAARVLAMDANAFEQHEATFHREELTRQPGTKPPELKRRYAALRAAREVKETLDLLRGLPGRVEYVCADVTDPVAVDEAVRSVAHRFGRIDLVMHGAGTQVSKALNKKKMDEFRAIVGTKVAGLGHLHRACRTHLPGHRIRFHVLTSAFSYFGNDGQPDYGAANEAMSRIAGSMAAAREDGGWTALGWLGWAGIGMTRGSEYAALARARGLRPLTRDEGQILFSTLLDGEPVAPVNVLVSEREAAFYGVQVDHEPDHHAADDTSQPRWRSPYARPDSIEVHWDLSLETHPYLGDHLVNGRPALPASFEAELASQAARALRVDRHAVTLENARLESFVKLRAGIGVRLRGRARVVDESADETTTFVQLLSDFVHKSGRVLRKDILHFESLVRMTRNTRELDPQKELGSNHDGRSIRISDPYLSPQAPVKLHGFFRCLRDIELAENVRRARFRIEETEKMPLVSEFLTPAILGDGLFRFSMIHVTESGNIPVYVPLRCGRIRMAPGINDAILHVRGEDLLLTASKPRVEEKLVHNEWAQVTDARGRVLLTAEALVAVRFGEVPRQND